MMPFLATVLVAAACTAQNTATTTSTAAGSSVDVPKPPPPASIAPVLRRPGPPGDALAGVPTLLGGVVLARDPIARVELWNGSELVEATDYENPQTELRTGWNWVPPGPGLFGLVLRAVDDQGGVATSFPLWVRVQEAPAPPTASAGVFADLASGSPGVVAGLIALQVGEDDEMSNPPADGLLGIAFPDPGVPQVSMDTESCEAKVKLPAVQGASGVAVYAAPLGSTGFIPVGLVPPEGGEVSLPVGAAPVLVYAEAFDSDQTNPGPPGLLVPPSPCAARGWAGDLSFVNGVLANLKGADRAYLYVSGDGGEVWERVPGADQTFVYPAPDGGFDFGGLLIPPSAGADVVLEAWGWVGGALTPLGRGTWAAPVPTTTAPGGGQQANPGGDLFAAPYTGPLVADSDLDWVLGFAVEKLQKTDVPILLRNGTICTYEPPAVAAPTTATVPVNVVGGTTSQPTTSSTSTIAVLPDDCTNAPWGAYSKTLRWRPVVGDLSHGLLQVSTMPPPPDPMVSFPGLVHTQKVDKPSGEFIDFEVPLNEIIDPPSAQASLPDYESMSYQVISDLAGSDAEGGSGGSNQAIKVVPPLLVQGAKATTFYLRVIPMKDNTLPLLGKSNSIVIHVDETAPEKLSMPVQPPSMSLDVRMTPPHLPNAGYQRCVRVVENPFGSKNPAPSQTPAWFEEHVYKGLLPPAAFDSFYSWAEQAAFIYENGVKAHKGLIPGATVCATQLDPPEKDVWDYVVDAVSFVGWVWDMYGTVWDMMKGWVADVIAYASGCVPLAQQLGKSKEEAEKLCSGVALTAINTALVAYGVPPTMPNFKDLAQLAKGELKEWVLMVAADQGLNCSVLQDQCEEMAEELLDELLDEMQIAVTEAATKGAMAGSQWVLYIHPGIYVVPEPAATLAPATFEIEITRSADSKAPAPPASCTYSAHVYGDKENYGWQNYFKGHWQTGAVSTNAVVAAKSVTVDLSDLQPGEARKAVIILDEIIPWYPEGQDPQLPNVPYWSVKPQTWIFFVDHTTAGYAATTLSTVLLGGPLCGAATQTHPQDSQATGPWEIPSP